MLITERIHVLVNFRRLPIPITMATIIVHGMYVPYSGVFSKGIVHEIFLFPF